MREVHWSERVAGGLAGLILGLFYLVWLINGGEIDIGYLSEASGTGWIPFVLIAAPTIGALLPGGRDTLPVVCLLLLVVALPGIDQLVGSHRTSAPRPPEDVERWKGQAAAAVMQEVGLTDLLAAVPGYDASCRSVLVWAGTPKGGIWYWYDVARNRLTGKVTESQLALEVDANLRAGDRIGRLLPAGGRPDQVAFTVAYPGQGQGKGQLQLARGCRFTLDSIDFVDPPAGVPAHVAPSLLLTGN